MQQLDGNELEYEVNRIPHSVSQEQADPSSLVPTWAGGHSHSPPNW